MQAGNMMQIYRLRKDISGVLLATGALLLSPSALAVKMGQVIQTSELSKPLDVTIELTQLNGLDAEDLTVSVASPDDFDLAGITYPPYLESIELELLVTGNNSGTIRLSSETPLNEPYLSLLLELSWAEGLIIQEYSILPEMPVFSSPSREVVQSASSSQPGQGSAGQGQVLTNPDAELTLPGSSGPSSVFTDVPQPGGDEYIIQAGDTLWSIAQNVRPSEDISVHQTMIALQRANPEAFPSGNINNIRPMSVLRVPSEQQILSLDSTEAIAEVQRQNRINEGLEAEPLVMNELESASGLAEESDELSVVSAEAELTSGADGAGSQSSVQLENEILLAEETIDRLTVENEELVSRITELSSQIELLEDMVVVKDEQIAELSQQSASLASENQLAALDEPVAPAQDNSGSLVDDIMFALQKNLRLIAGGAAVILLFVLGLMFYRKRARDDEFDDGDDELAHEDEPAEDDDLGDIINTGVTAEVSSAAGSLHDDEAAYDEQPEREEESAPEAVYEVSDDIEESLSDDHLDDLDDDFYSVIQVDEDDLAQARAPAKNAEAAEENEESDSDELAGVLGASADAMNPNRDIQGSSERDEKTQADDDSEFVSEAADEISSAIHDLDEPVEADEVGDSDSDSDSDADDGFMDDDFSNITFDESHVIEDDEEDDADEPASGIDLAVAYEAMGDINGARELLQKALFEGTEEERIQARKLLDEWKDR